MHQFLRSDPFYLEDQLSEEERMIRDAARAYAQNELQPPVAEAFAQEHTDTAIFSEMGRKGCSASPFPRHSGARVQVM